MPKDLPLFDDRKPLGEILEIPKRVQSVYSLTQHIWAGENEEQRRASKKQNRVRLETLDEFLIDPVRGYLNRIFERVAGNEGQGWWLQAEFGVGKSHLLAATSILAIGGEAAWEHIKKREDEEKKAGPGARLDSLWRQKIEKRKVFPIVFSLEGVGGTEQSRLEDFILDEAQKTFALREGKPLAVYPEEHLAGLFLREHQRIFEDDLRRFLADKRLMRGLPSYEYTDLIKALKQPESQRDAGRLLLAFYRHKSLQPQVPVERGERLSRMVQDILEAGYDGIFIAIDEMSEYLRKSSHNTAEDEDCLLVLSNKLAKVDGKPVWTLVAAQMAHTNPQKIIAPDRLSQEILEHKPERFRDIVAQRTRKIKDIKEVRFYFEGYRNLVPWVKESSREDFEAAFPFPPESLVIMRSISAKLTGTRSTIGFLHRALQKAAEAGSKELVPLWRVFDDLMSYSETPSTSSTGTISIRSRFRDEVAALESAQNTLKRINDGQLARPQNRTRAERILNTLFLYHLAGIPGLDKNQILDAVCDLKPGEDQLEAQLAHYETILDEMRNKLRNQIRYQNGRYEFVKKETSQYDDLVYQETERLKQDPQLLEQWMDRLIALKRDDVENQFAAFVSETDGIQKLLKVEDWHGQERSGRVTAADLGKTRHQNLTIDTHGNEDDFLVVLARRPATDKAIEKWLAKDKPADPRLVVWAPAQLNDQERAQLAEVLAKLKLCEENKDSAYGKQAWIDFRQSAHRGYAALQSVYGRGAARTSRGSVVISLVGGIEGALRSMAKEALDTCYKSRDIDFGSRKFDTPNAVKLINGIVKRGVAVSEGDALWSAVENFAPPLGIVRPEAPKRLDPSASPFYQEIRKKIEDSGALGIDIRTVYNWFTGYNPSDGQESMGLTRRLVDVYLLCLAQQGVVRIGQLRGGWIDRSTIATIEFKPDTLRGLGRIELPRALDDWEVFYPYLEVLTGLDGRLGPKYDKAAADDALRLFWESRWIEKKVVEDTERDIRELFEALGQREKHPFDELLLYWLEFSDEGRPETSSEDDVYQWLRRAVLRVAGVSDVDSLSPEHLTRFREAYRQWADLEASFTRTSSILLRAAKLSSAPLPEGTGYREIAKAQEAVRKELAHCEELMLNPDGVNTRLAPRLSQLENPFVEAYLGELMRLDSLQGQVRDLKTGLANAPELEALTDFAADVPEAHRILEEARQTLCRAPAALRPVPEDRDRAEKDVRRDAKVKDLGGQELTLRRLKEEADTRLNAQTELSAVPADALREFAAFLVSPGVLVQLKSVEKPPRELKEIVEANTPEEVAECLQTMPAIKRQELAKVLKLAVGRKRAKTVSLSSFRPPVDIVWDQDDLNRVVKGFEQFLLTQWDDESYLKVE
jgi:hypothetical protein